jgi:hypothetical protein
MVVDALGAVDVGAEVGMAIVGTLGAFGVGAEVGVLDTGALHATRKKSKSKKNFFICILSMARVSIF